jgi:hypothetical protein
VPAQEARHQSCTRPRTHHTGPADDDPSAIGTYASAGAELGPSFLWTAPVTLPMMFAVVYLSAKLGQVSGPGLFQVMKDYYPRWVLYPTLIGVLIGNTIEADGSLMPLPWPRAGGIDSTSLMTGEACFPALHGPEKPARHPRFCHGNEIARWENEDRSLCRVFAKGTHLCPKTCGSFRAESGSWRIASGKKLDGRRGARMNSGNALVSTSRRKHDLLTLQTTTVEETCRGRRGRSGATRSSGGRDRRPRSQPTLWRSAQMPTAPCTSWSWGQSALGRICRTPPPPAGSAARAGCASDRPRPRPL